MQVLARFIQKLWELKGTPQLIKDTISFASAIVSGRKVSVERIQTRIAICSQCENAAVTPQNIMVCLVCNCALKKTLELRNLAAYEETSMYGCKHKDGSKWKESGV